MSGQTRELSRQRRARRTQTRSLSLVSSETSLAVFSRMRYILRASVQCLSPMSHSLSSILRSQETVLWPCRHVWTLTSTKNASTTTSSRAVTWTQHTSNLSPSCPTCSASSSNASFSPTGPSKWKKTSALMRCWPYPKTQWHSPYDSVFSTKTVKLEKVRHSIDCTQLWSIWVSTPTVVTTFRIRWTATTSGRSLTTIKSRCANLTPSSKTPRPTSFSMSLSSERRLGKKRGYLKLSFIDARNLLIVL